MMEFDVDQIAVPFRMQPGLQRLEGEGPWLTPLAPGSALAREKRAVVEAGQALHQVLGFHSTDAINSIAHYDHAISTTGRFCKESGLQTGLTGTAACSLRDDLPLALRFEEDLAILDGETGTLPWLCVCVPSHWAPEDKLGLPFGAVHAPVADSAALQVAAAQLVRLVTGGEVWQRWVWTITPSGRYDQHPRRTARAPWPDATDTAPEPAPDPAASPAADPCHPAHFARQCWLRVERQRFLPVRAPDGTLRRQAIFAIRVMLQPLPEAVQTRAQAQRLHDSLASMTDAVLDYKNLRAARAPLLRWLREWRPAC